MEQGVRIEDEANERRGVVRAPRVQAKRALEVAGWAIAVLIFLYAAHAALSQVNHGVGSINRSGGGAAHATPPA